MTFQALGSQSGAQGGEVKEVIPADLAEKGGMGRVVPVQCGTQPMIERGGAVQGEADAFGRARADESGGFAQQAFFSGRTTEAPMEKVA